MSLHRFEMWEAEALIVRPDISTIRDLNGKTIAAPRGSTSHYQLLYFLHTINMTKSVSVRMAQPSELAELWQAGEIDGAFVWAPHSDQLRAMFDTRTLIAGGAVARLGAPTFVAYVCCVC